MLVVAPEVNVSWLTLKCTDKSQKQFKSPFCQPIEFILHFQQIGWLTSKCAWIARRCDDVTSAKRWAELLDTCYNLWKETYSRTLNESFSGTCCMGHSVSIRIFILEVHRCGVTWGAFESLALWQMGFQAPSLAHNCTSVSFLGAFSQEAHWLANPWPVGWTPQLILARVTCTVGCGHESKSTHFLFLQWFWLYFRPCYSPLLSLFLLALTTQAVPRLPLHSPRPLSTALTSLKSPSIPSSDYLEVVRWHHALWSHAISDGSRIMTTCKHSRAV